MDAEINEKCESRRNMRALVKFNCLKGKTSKKKFEKMKSIYNDGCQELNASVRTAQGIFGKERNNELRDSQQWGQPPTPSTEINLNTVRTLIEEDRSLVSRDGGHNGLFKVED